MFAEVLTGLSLVKASVSYIKDTISTAKDMTEIVDAVDQLLDGEQQINKDRSKKDGISFKDQLGIKGVAHEVIDAKLAAEMRYEMSVLIDQRFGHGTFQEIVNLRAKRIQEAKEEAKKIAKIKKQKKDELLEIIAVVLAILIVGGLLLTVFATWLKAEPEVSKI
tara:strand:- start:198 stop:689 length:492 start_codon:yes stop_codon:yes gene_type:complete